MRGPRRSSSAGISHSSIPSISAIPVAEADTLSMLCALAPALSRPTLLLSLGARDMPHAEELSQDAAAAAAEPACGCERRWQ